LLGGGGSSLPILVPHNFYLRVLDSGGGCAGSMVSMVSMVLAAAVINRAPPYSHDLLRCEFVRSSSFAAWMRHSSL
jgi:hypothetical protein